MLMVFAAIVLLIVSAVLSSLAFGLQSLSLRELKREASYGSHDAQSILDLKQHGYKLFVTLILADAIINTALIVVLAQIVQPFWAIAIGSSAIIIFGEIVPRSLEQSRIIRLSGELSPVLEKLTWTLSPIAAPLGRLLDDKFDNSQIIHDQSDLLSLLEASSSNMDSDISSMDHLAVERILDFSNRKVSDRMTPIESTRLLGVSEQVDLDLLDELHALSQEYFLVADDDKVVGTVHIQELIDFRGNQSVGSATSKGIAYLHHQDNLQAVVDAFMKTKHTFFVVVDGSGEVIGVLAFEHALADVFGDGLDDFDDYDSLRATLRKDI